MKWFIVGTALFMISLRFLFFQTESDRNLIESEAVKFTAQEAASAAAQYFIDTEYAEGRYIFNQEEGIKAAEYVIKTDLELDNNFMPTKYSYWRDQVSYTIEFFDEQTIGNTAGCTEFPCLYIHDTTDFSLAIAHPTVIITINTGRARYTFMTEPTVYRTGAHEWKEYSF